MKLSLFLHIGLLSVLSLSACKTVNTTQRAMAFATPEMVDEQRVITDRTLDFKARILSVNQANLGSGDLLKVQVELHNNGYRRKHFSYRFEWFDQNAMLIEMPAPIWIPKEIEGGETIALTALAPNPRAKDFRIKLVEK